MLFYLFGFFQDAKGKLNLRKADMPIHIRSMKLCWIVGMRKSWRQRAANNNFSVPIKWFVHICTCTTSIRIPMQSAEWYLLSHRLSVNHWSFSKTNNQINNQTSSPHHHPSLIPPYSFDKAINWDWPVGYFSVAAGCHRRHTDGTSARGRRDRSEAAPARPAIPEFSSHRHNFGLLFLLFVVAALMLMISDLMVSIPAHHTQPPPSRKWREGDEDFDLFSTNWIRSTLFLHLPSWHYKNKFKR